MPDLMQQIAERSAARAAEREATWNTLVEAAANNVAAPEDVVELLDAMHRTPDDFTAAVDQYRRRLALAAEVDAGREAAKRRDAATAELQRLDAAFAEARAKHDRRKSEIEDVVTRENVLVQAGSAAERELAGLPKPGTMRGGSPGTF